MDVFKFYENDFQVPYGEPTARNGEQEQLKTSKN
jgi:hypothetical protein